MPDRAFLQGLDVVGNLHGRGLAGGGGRGRQPNRRGLHLGSLVQPRVGYQIDP
jgi:hypothetical protein